MFDILRLKYYFFQLITKHPIMKKLYFISLTLLVFALSFTALQVSETTAPPPPPGGNPILPSIPYSYEFDLPDHISLPSSGGYGQVPANDFHLITDARATLGRVLFYDTRLSLNDDLSCGSCHKQERSFADDKRFSEGIDMTAATRNTPNINDLGWRTTDFLFWDMREDDLGDLALLPALNEDELGNDLQTIIERVEAAPFYGPLFIDAFGSTSVTQLNISDALEQFMNSMTTFETRWDIAANNNFQTFTIEEQEGRELFEESCAICHSPPNFMSDMVLIANNGLDADFSNDGGLGEFNGNPDQLGLFKSPTLRNIELTAPYMHDGRFETLEDVINFYSDSLKTNGSSMSEMPFFNLDSSTGFAFDEEEKIALKAFLLTLTDENFITDPRFSDPFPQTVNTTIVELEGVQVFPNPTVDALQIKLPENGQSTIHLTSVDGRRVFSDNTFNRDYILERNGLPSGIYFLRIEANAKIKTMKVVFE